MKLEWFDAARNKARKRLAQKKGLSIWDLHELFNMEDYAPQINIEQERLIQVLLEIKCAKHVSQYLDAILGEGLGKGFRSLFVILEKYAIFSESENEHTESIKSIPFSFEKMLEESFGNKQLYIQNDSCPEGVSNRAILSFASFRLASMAVDSAHFDIAQDIDTNVKPSFYDTFWPDPFTTKAVIVALEATGGRLGYSLLNISSAQRKKNVIFWTWYLEEAFPWAVAETAKRLPSVEG